MSKPIDATVRFWLLVEKTDGCWKWNGAKDTFGYGVIWRDGKTIKAPRFSYELHIGTIPQGMFVCHACDNPECVRPDHLWVGTADDNNKDCVRKGRGKSCAKEQNILHRNPELSPTHLNPELTRGERNGNAKLTEAQVIAIRNRHAQGDISCSELAREHHVSRSIVSRIIRGELWHHTVARAEVATRIEGV